MLDAQIPEAPRRRSTFYVSLGDSGETENTSSEECRHSTSSGNNTKKSLLSGLFRSPSGLDLGRNSKSTNKNITSLESLNKKLDYDDELNKTNCSLSSIGSESDFSYTSLENCSKEDSRILAKRIRRREYSKRNAHLLRNSLENCSTPTKKQIIPDLSYNSSDYKSVQKSIKPIELFKINKSHIDSDKNVLSPTTKSVSKRNSMLTIEDRTPKYSPKCVTLPNNLSAKTCLDYGEKKAAPKPREIALSPAEPPGRRLAGFSFIRRTHSTKINRSPSLLKALTSKCVDDGHLQKKDSVKDDNKKKLIDDEDQAVLSGMLMAFIFICKMMMNQ